MGRLFDMSLATANAVYGLANAVTIVAAVLTVIGVGGVVWSGRVRDQYTAEETEKLRHGTAVAQSTAASANEKAAELTRSNLMLQIDLEREKSARRRLERVVPRRITRAQMNELASVLEPFAGQRFFLTFPLNNLEAHQFAEDLSALVTRAGWVSLFAPPDTVGPGSGALIGPGLSVHLASDDMADRHLARAARAAVAVLKRMGLRPVNTITAQQGWERGVVGITIGAQSP